MIEANERPLVTFALFAYKQERFIREAVAGAFAQTYSPLEIILSDDCSTDRTFEIMQEMAAAYHGPHKLILNRNSKQLGLGAHVNRLMELARGDFIVVGAGDDVPAPERVERVCREFDGADNVMAVFSDMIEIDGNGRTLRKTSTLPPQGFDNPVECCRHMLRGITGASNAWHRKVFDAFGPMLPEVVFEDRVIALRAVLLGTVRHIPEPLVKYRRHETNTVAMFHTEGLQSAKRTLDCFLWAYRSAERDLEKYVTDIQPDFPGAARCRRIIRRRIRKLEAYLQIHSGKPHQMFRGLTGLAMSGGNLLQGMKLFAKVLR